MNLATAQWQINSYASNKYIVYVATIFFTNWDDIQGWGRGDFSTSLNMQMNCSVLNMNPIEDLVRIHCIAF